MVTTRGAAAKAAASNPTSSQSSPSIPLGKHNPYNSLLVALLLAPPLAILLTLRKDAFGGCRDAHRFIMIQLLLALLGFISVIKMVEVGKDFCRRKGNTGRDLCKKGTSAGEIDIPESQGLATGVIYLIIIIICQLMYAQTDAHLATYNSSLLSICFMLFLGFVDDVLVSVKFTTHDDHTTMIMTSSIPP